ncbi:MAG: T9SS type A sorting domain-containing protein, partial [Ignavibacteriaceae bacterium]|nr:T9SS type A sorting domain-containing protein [Ignavibacteriaceae bacterium]
INDFKGIVPSEFQLSQNYPNPFNPSTVIRYSLPNTSKVVLNIYNSLGQEVMRLKDETNTAGIYEVQFNSSKLSSGVYFYQLIAESVDGNKSFTSTKKMILMK